MRISFLFAWFDLWVGAFWDRKARKLYVFPVPCVGLVFDFGERARRVAPEKAEEDLEAAYWRFDTAKKRSSLTERDAFKAATRWFMGETP